MDKTEAQIGEPGRTIAFGRSKLTDEEKNNLRRLRKCPINKNFQVKMSKGAFRRACLKCQQHVIATFTANTETKVMGRLTRGGFYALDRELCSECQTGKDVREGKEFTPPNDKVEFIVFNKDISKYAGGKGSRTQLTDIDITKIKQLRKEGYTIEELMVMWPSFEHDTLLKAINPKRKCEYV